LYLRPVFLFFMCYFVVLLQFSIRHEFDATGFTAVFSALLFLAKES
jgi:hypothetical protein